MQLSQRITTLTGGGSDGWDVFYKARRMRAKGINVTELTIGEHDIRTDPTILAAMHRAATGGHTGYAIVPGTQSLRETVAQRVQERTGVPTTYRNVLITPGGQSALFAAHMAACNPGDTALYVDPYYATYPGTLRAVGAHPRPIPTRAHNSFLPGAQDILTAAEQDAASLLINTPNNPTGTGYGLETLQQISQTCKEKDLWLISDEVYDTQVWHGHHISPRSLDGMAERTLVVGSMSKSHAMTGSRIGWIIAPEDVVTHLINLSTHTTYGVAGFIQDAAEFALTQGSDLEQKIAAPFQRRQVLAQQILQDQSAVTMIPAQGAMYLMLDIRATGLGGEAFAHQLLDQHHIAVMSGESFGQSAAGHIRVAMTVADDVFAAALQTLVAFAEELSGLKVQKRHMS